VPTLTASQSSFTQVQLLISIRSPPLTKAGRAAGSVSDTMVSTCWP
jgi:hypothetical protein